MIMVTLLNYPEQRPVVSRITRNIMSSKGEGRQLWGCRCNFPEGGLSVSHGCGRELRTSNHIISRFEAEIKQGAHLLAEPSGCRLWTEERGG